MGTEQSEEPSGDEQCARGAAQAVRALGILAHCTQLLPLSGLWEPVLKGSSGQSLSAGLLGWLMPCILRCHRAAEPGRQEHDSPNSPSPLFSPQAAPSPRAFCVPRIILTECIPNPPSPPEARPEEASPRTIPTPRPRTLAGGGRGCDGAWAPQEVMAKASQPRSSLAPEKEGTALKTLGIESRTPAEGRPRAPCPWGPAPDGTQESSTVETHPEKTPKDTGQDAQAHSREPRAQSAAGPGCTVRGAAAQRRDSLEETLRELEATLSQMGTALSAGTPGSPPPLPPSPQVAASSPSSSSCLCHSGLV
uniref:Uncharacterized protein n=1 Tax=Ailuropoda melanoleuca TaxID=9646 RepID=G1LCT4_AILME